MRPKWVFFFFRFWFKDFTITILMIICLIKMRMITTILPHRAGYPTQELILFFFHFPILNLEFWWSQLMMITMMLPHSASCPGQEWWLHCISFHHCHTHCLFCICTKYFLRSCFKHFILTILFNYWPTLFHHCHTHCPFYICTKYFLK